MSEANPTELERLIEQRKCPDPCVWNKEGLAQSCIETGDCGCNEKDVFDLLAAYRKATTRCQEQGRYK